MGEDVGKRTLGFITVLEFMNSCSTHPFCILSPSPTIVFLFGELGRSWIVSYHDSYFLQWSKNSPRNFSSKCHNCIILRRNHILYCRDEILFPCFLCMYHSPSASVLLFLHLIISSPIAFHSASDSLRLAVHTTQLKLHSFLIFPINIVFTYVLEVQSHLSFKIVCI